MRLEKQYEEDIARRKGLTKRTIIQVIWLGISGVIMYFLVTSLEKDGLINYREMANAFNLPITIPDWVFIAIIVAFGIVLMQLLLFIGFAFGSPEGRRKSGTPSLHSRNKDPLDSQY